jgi:site-specific recombinase XerD
MPRDGGLSSKKRKNKEGDSWTKRMVAAIKSGKEIPADIPDVPEVNKQVFIKQLDKLRSQGKAKNTIIKHAYYLRMFFKILGDKDFYQTTREDIEKVLVSFDSSYTTRFIDTKKKGELKKFSPESKRTFRVVIKYIYKQLIGDDEDYPKQVKKIKTTGKKTDKKLPKNLITQEEFIQLINACMNLRDKAVIALLYDAGPRIGELVNLKKGDVDFSSQLTHITLDGKTGMRTIPISLCVPYLSQYINTIKDVKPDEPLFYDTGSWSDLRKPVSRATISMMLKKITKRAKLEKRIYPHLFRHTSATNFTKRKHPEAELRYYYGWSHGSKTPSTYVTLSGRDMDDSYLENIGKKPVAKEQKATTINCKNCGTENGITDDYCSKCHSVIGKEESLRLEGKLDDAREGMMEVLKDQAKKDPKFIEELIHYYYLAKRRKKDD